MGSSCPLCGPALAPVLREARFWRVVLNRNQNLLGKTMLVLGRHVEDVTQLMPAEWEELHAMLGWTKRCLDMAFHPDHFNYAFLQNVDRHVHLHVIPRYAGPREFAGASFDDLDYPGHYRVPSPPRVLAGDALAAIAHAVAQEGHPAG